jgi:hypothetical protein
MHGRRLVAIDLAEALQARRDQAALFDRIRGVVRPHQECSRAVKERMLRL